ncbi:MAG: hypothetical protein IJT94_09080 [Oscillibacter sp.]|nr:hypothetical protein [Oscillibacter sp.]
MSKTRDLWWGYVKNCIRSYPRWCAELEGWQSWLRDPDGSRKAWACCPKRVTENTALDNIAQSYQYVEFCGQRRVEFDGVRFALEETLAMEDGLERYKVLNLIFWARDRKNIAGAALERHVSERTARRWHTEFIRLVAKKMRLI